MMKYLHRLLIAVLVLAGILIVFVYIHERNDGIFRIYFLDVGQGDTIYMRSPSGHDMLIDGGASGIVLRRLSEIMPWYERSIDVVVETHSDTNHAGGLPDVLRSYKAGVFLSSDFKSSSPIAVEIGNVIKEKGIDALLVQDGMRVDFQDGSSFHLSLAGKVKSQILVGKLSYGSTSIIISGDSQKTLDALNGFRIPTLHANGAGTIEFESDGREIWRAR